MYQNQANWIYAFCIAPVPKVSIVLYSAVVQAAHLTGWIFFSVFRKRLKYSQCTFPILYSDIIKMCLILMKTKMNDFTDESETINKYFTQNVWLNLMTFLYE